MAILNGFGLVASAGVGIAEKVVGISLIVLDSGKTKAGDGGYCYFQYI